MKKKDTQDAETSQVNDYSQRIRYSELLYQAENIRNQVNQGENTNFEEISDVLDRATSIISNGENDTTLVSLDAQLMAIGSSVAKQAAQNINTNLEAFSLSEFPERILDYITSNGPTNWDLFHQFNYQCHRDIPIFFSFSGELNNQTKPVIKPKKQREKLKKSNTKLTKSQQEKTKDNTESDFDKTIMRIHKILKREYKNNSENDLNYFEFIINPHSFTKTIENVFHCSFLIKDCLAEIQKSKSGNVLIKPKLKAHSSENTINLKSETIHQQASLSINIKLWREIIKKYNIRQPKIDLEQNNFDDSEEDSNDDE